ncbi:hypothetical protein [Ruminococcus sp. zg-924]|uniref:hypothetical protein n=1 Tax=Ruminococcus sp. zg-924 TaxID=2678505 RepID=UPI00210C0561|nr:hypothetical protein [Ruminococcus sp. zg-924]MCQ4022849.1 hypothetical protein [Ruminococcus sp. zg-924]
MAKIEESAVYEFCEHVYEELSKKDGGYHPSKHDSEMLRRTSEQFSISEENVDRIYKDYTKVAADIEIQKIKKLPLHQQRQIMIERFGDILKNNKDLPYYKLEGEPSKPLESQITMLSDEYEPVVRKVAEAEWTIPLSIDVKHFQELKQISEDISKLDNFFEKYYSKGKFNTLCRKIKNAFDNLANRNLFDECIASYKAGHYSICVNSLISLLEGLISTFGDNINDVRVMRVCKYHSDEEKKNNNLIKSLCWESIYEFCKVLFKKSNFSDAEPPEMNRHWIEHGRTSKEYEKIDCLKLINALSTVTIFKQNMSCEI